MLVSLIVFDTPISYTPPMGQPIHFTLRYNQREADQPANFNYGNVGPKWTHHWLTYIEDSPTQSMAGVSRIVAGGGAVDYGGFDPATGEFRYGPSERARLLRVSTNPIIYERYLPDGSEEVYAHDDGATTGLRRVFLTRRINPQGQTTTFSYEHPGNDKLITRIIDPFGREAVLHYDARGRLSSITDPIGIVSSFSYDDGHFMTSMHTPYGTTRFACRGNGTSRSLMITDPLAQI